MATTYTVKKGDTLSEIAQAHSSQISGSALNDKVNTLVKLNNIPNKNLIYVGQVIKLSGTAETPKKVTTAQVPVIKHWGLQADTDRTIYVGWAWDRSNTDQFSLVWQYTTGSDTIKWFEGTRTTVESNIKQATYGAPQNATGVRFYVKAIAKTKKDKNGKETKYWKDTGWSTGKYYYFKDAPATPSAPTVTIEGSQITAEVNNVDPIATHVDFEFVKNDTTVTKKYNIKVNTGRAVHSGKISVGNRWKVRCRAKKGSLISDWSDYTDNMDTVPPNVKGAPTCEATSATSVRVSWKEVTNATSYDLQYTTEKRYFEGSDQVSVQNGIETTHFEKTGLTSGDEYFFRVRSVNDEGYSGWSSIGSIIIGKPPAAPTTWSSTTTAITGEDLILYWVHNAEDSSRQTYAELELTIDGETETHTIQNEAVDDEEDEEKTSSYTLSTTDFLEGAQILWRVRTAGITNEYGDWSVERTVDIYSQPTIDLEIINGSGTSIDTLTHFPFYVSALAGPITQQPISYHLVVTADESYETVNDLGNAEIITAGQEVYSKHFDINDPLMVELSAHNVNLENNIPYTVTCVVSMDSGLTAEASAPLEVAWTDILFSPNAEISVNYDDYSVNLTPYCLDEDEALCNNVVLSVYRREFDGAFTELITGINNSYSTSIIDPHPALDYARYRIVAKSTITGSVSYYDMPGEPVGGTSAIIQWDEEWSIFEVPEDVQDELVNPPWSGSMLMLHYNIDISNSYKNDAKLVDYIGRKYGVSYYGTKVDSISTWNVDIDKKDEETIYQLRRLAAWQGDVYVRTPSGEGHWANVTVSFNENHNEVIIPVTINVTRVEGGA